MNGNLRRVAAACFVVLIGAAPHDPDARYETAQHRVDLGGGRYMNIDCRGSGSPPVVLDTAIGSTTYVWSKVAPAIAQRVQVCAYDRAGYGFSDPSGVAHTTENNVTDLHVLLARAHIAPPYVIVAHSLSGFDARVYADRYRADVAGLVLIDPSDEGEDRFAAIYGPKKYAADQAKDVAFVEACDRKADAHGLRSGDDCVGPPDPALSPRFRAIQQRHAMAAATWDAVLSEMTSIPADVREVRADQRPYGNLPMTVLTAGATEDGEQQAGATDAQIRAAKHLWTLLRNGEAAQSQRGVNCEIPSAGHYLQLEKPDVVIAAVLDVVAASKTSAEPDCANLAK
jgi:pimeloyl-ACP methyl ester carboxylesterase